MVHNEFQKEKHMDINGIDSVWTWAEDFVTLFTKRFSNLESIEERVETAFRGLEARPSLDFALISQTGIYAAMVKIGMIHDNGTMFPHRARGLVLKWENEYPWLRRERWQPVGCKLILAIHCGLQTHICISFGKIGLTGD